MRKFLVTTAAIGAGYFAAEFILDRWVIKSDDQDPTGMILQSEGFGLDDVVRIATIGAAGALALGLVSKWTR